MQITPELQLKIAEWRRKCNDGSITLEELREAIQHLRAGRVSAAAASEGARKKSAKKVTKSGEDLLSDLDNFFL